MSLGEPWLAALATCRDSLQPSEGSFIIQDSSSTTGLSPRAFERPRATARPSKSPRTRAGPPPTRPSYQNGAPRPLPEGVLRFLY
ncbi:hypothetical protein C5O22_07945 [Treponema sp. J25]|nr:hypothetical protein C5O22_07945 [Treponema sp. J25]